MKIESYASYDTAPPNVNEHTELITRLRSTQGSGGEGGEITKESTVDESSENIISEEMLENSINQANNALKEHAKYIERHIHEVTKTVMYVIRDRETNEIIREFPPEKIQDMLAKMWELAGLFVDERR